MNSGWYESVNQNPPITQGELIFDCPVFGWSPEKVEFCREGTSETLEATKLLSVSHVVVMTQACDLEQNKVDNVVLCPFTTLVDFHQEWIEKRQSSGKGSGNKDWKQQCNQIRNGYIWNLAMLKDGKSDGLGNKSLPNPLIVDFHEIW